MRWRGLKTRSPYDTSAWNNRNVGCDILTRDLVKCFYSSAGEAFANLRFSPLGHRYGRSGKDDSVLLWSVFLSRRCGGETYQRVNGDDIFERTLVFEVQMVSALKKANSKKQSVFFPDVRWFKSKKTYLAHTYKPFFALGARDNPIIQTATKNWLTLIMNCTISLKYELIRRPSLSPTIPPARNLALP